MDRSRKRSANQDQNTRVKTPKTKLQTPEKFQITSSKAATSRAELGFGAWNFFGVWSFGFGIFLELGVWDLVFSP